MDCSPPSSSVHGIPQARYWSGLPFPLPGDLPDPRVKRSSPAVAGTFFTTESPGKPSYHMHCCCCFSRSVLSDSLRPHGPLTRLLCPWDSPGKNTGVSCHFLLQSHVYSSKFYWGGGQGGELAKVLPCLATPNYQSDHFN